MKVPGRLIRGSVRPDRNSLRRFASLRWAALPIVDRRWTAPLSAIALGFGLFVGVAIGPGTESGLGTSKPMVIRLPAPPETQTASAPPVSSGSHGDRAGGQGGQADQSPPASPPPSIDSPPSVDAPSFTNPPPVTTPPIYPTTPTYPTTPPSTNTTTTSETGTGGDQAETTTTFTGAVVHLNPAAASYSIATEDGRLIAVHSHRPPAVGDRIEVEAKAFANGTYSEVGHRDKVGNAGRAEFSGTVSYSDPVNRVYTVSAPGVSALVRGGEAHRPPGLGEQVEVEARIADHPEELPVSEPGQQGCGQPPAQPKPPKTALDQVRVRTTADEPQTTTTVEAVVEGVCRTDRRLIVSADDVRESGHDIAIAIPEEFRVAALKPGQVLKLGTEIGAAGALSLSSVAGDEGAHGAEDPDLVQP